MTTNVPQPTFGANGFTFPSEAAIYTGVFADINAAFGGNLNPSIATPQGQLSTTEAAVIGDCYAMFAWYCNQVDPALNEGRMQDAIGRIYYMTRFEATSTVAQCVCSGLDGVVIPVGALAQGVDGNLYVCQEQGTIVGGSVTLQFACAVTGPISCPENNVNSIYQAIFGWDTINNPTDGTLGSNAETPQQFEARRSASVAANALGILDAILGSVLAVTGVLDAYVTENYNAYPAPIGGYILGPNSIYVAVLGGAAADVAMAIWTRKAPGAGYNGNTTQQVQDPSPQYIPPVPTYYVTWEIATDCRFCCSCCSQIKSEHPHQTR